MTSHPATPESDMPRTGRAAIYERAFQLERRLAQAQARVAELEKDAARYSLFRDAMTAKSGPLEDLGWKLIDIGDPNKLDAAIDEALKDRA